MRKPFYKESRDAWYFNHPNGQRIKLGKTKDEAYDAWRKMDLEAPAPEQPTPAPAAPANGRLTVADLVEIYLEWVGRPTNRSSTTHVAYTRALKPLKVRCGATAAVDLRPKDLDAVVAKCLTTYKTKDGVVKEYSDSTRWQFYKATVAMFNWAKEQGHIESHSLSRIKDRPECNVRQDWIEQPEFDKLIGACDEPLFRELLIVLWDTGARPFEILQAQAKHLDRQSRCLRFARANGDKVKAKRKKKDATRTVRLSKRAFGIVAKLADQYPEGLLFRNTCGEGWTPNLISHRLRVLRKRTGVKATCYTFRHSFCTRLILDNVNIRKVQELMGHSDLKMIAAVYAHLNKADNDLNDVLDKLAG